MNIEGDTSRLEATAGHRDMREQNQRQKAGWGAVGLASSTVEDKEERGENLNEALGGGEREFTLGDKGYGLVKRQVRKKFFYYYFF